MAEPAATPIHDGNDFEEALRYLRRLGACEPPVGVGSFDLLYANAHEVVVWYSPAREEHREGEVAIPCAGLALAWAALLAGETLDEAALEGYGGGAARGRWLLALLAQLPGVTVCEEPLALRWACMEVKAEAETKAPTIETLAAETPAVATEGKRRVRRARRVEDAAK